MTTGLNATNIANPFLNAIRGTSAASFTAITTLFVQLHTGDPGANGTANVSSVTTRPALNYAAASAGSQSLTGTPPAWANWAGTNGEVIADISVWDASTSGNFLYSAALSASKTVNTGDTVTLSSISVAFTPIAA